ncbi:MAG: hypothetical protein Q7S36_03115 [Candidatus Liptonbacteria bacterium]|nr:hypothetical protein [Candidatus Liptonbacteria bacterium]
MINLFKLREKFLIFNVEPEGARSVLVGVDADKKLHFDEAQDRFKLPKFFKNLGKHKTVSVVSLHPSLGAVRIVPFRFVRQLQSVPLELTELENFLAQLSQKIFLELRAEVAKELGSEELDSILIEVRPFAYRSDGSSVTSPLGHRSKEIYGFLELLFTTRGAFDLMQPVLYSGTPVFMTMHDKSELMSLKKLGHAKIAFLEFGRDGGARLLKYDLDKNKKELLSRKPIGWSPERFFARIEEIWNVDRAVAEIIYGEYLQNRLSPKLKIHLEKLWKREMAELFSRLKKAGAKGDVYIKTPLALPASFPAKQKGITLKAFPFADLFSRLGFEFDENLSGFPLADAFAHLAPFLECYYDSSDRQVNHSLRRRIHWLIS